MPGIFDVLAANGILSSLFGGQDPQANAAAPRPALDTGDDTERMRKRVTGVGSVTNPTAPVPLIVQAMENGGVPVDTAGASFLPPDAEQAMAQAQIDPRTIPSAPDPYANTANARGTAFQNQMALSEGPGTYDKFVRAADLIGKGLMAAGSPDPAKTLAMFQEADTERNKTKVTPMADGAFSLVQEPGKPARIVRNDEVAQYLGDQQTTKFQQALQKVILGGQVQANTAADKAAIKTGEEARPLLNDVTGMIGRWQEAQKIIQGQGTWAQVQAIPGIKGIAGFFGGDEVAANKFLEGLTVDETLLNTARTKGAISNQEMALFKSPIPSTTDDREKVWKPWIEARLKVLDKLKTFYEGEVARGSAAGGQPTASQPATKQNNQGSDLSAQAASAFGAYEPDVYEYRVNNGVLQRRKK